MKKFLLLSIATGLTVVTSGCFHCFQRTQAARPCMPAAPCCAPTPACGSPCDSTGVVTTVPGMTVPGGAVQVMPGPEAYATP